MNILLTADEAAGHQVFQLLKESSHDVAAVITPEDNFEIRSLAARLSIPVLNPDNLKKANFAQWVKSKNIDVLLNVHLYYIIQPEIIAAVKKGSFNLHPGPLPAYSGLHNPSWAIYNREKEYGVTLHWIEEGLETGHIAYRETIPIEQHDTGLTLSTKCVDTGIKLISKLLRKLSDEFSTIPKIPQDLSKRAYFGGKDKPQDAQINWSQTSTEIDALVRACNYAPFKSPWGYPKTEYRNSDIEISSLVLTDETCSSAPGTIKLDRHNYVQIATADKWVSLKTCGVGGKQVPAHTIFEEGDVLG